MGHLRGLLYLALVLKNSSKVSGSVWLLKSGIFFLLLVWAQSATAQIQPPPCQDTNAVNPYYPCPDFFQPVCGCNNVTYRNTCAAVNQGAVYNWRGGPCEPVYVVFYPNPVVDIMKLYMATDYERDVFIMIYDMHGKLRFYEKYIGIEQTQIELDLRTLPLGVYYMRVFTDGYLTMLPFIQKPAY